MDSGATAHMCKERGEFIEYTESPTVHKVNSAKNNASLKVVGHGTVVLRVWNGTFWINARLDKTLHAHELNKNIFSLTAPTARGIKVEINSDGCTVPKRGRIVATGMRCGMLFNFNVEVFPQCHVFDNEAELWHRRLGHASYSTVKKFITDDCITGKYMDP